MYAKKKTVTMFGMNVEVYQLPNGEYTMSKTQVGQVINKDDRSVPAWLNGNSPEVIPYKDFSFPEVSIAGNNKRFHSVPFDMAVSYWTYHARQGNEIALAIMANCTVEKMNRLADEAFNVEKTEVEYNLQFTSRQPDMETMAEVVNMLATMCNRLENMEETMVAMQQSEEELKQLKDKGVKHPGCLGVLEHETEDEIARYTTAREFVEEKGIGSWTLVNTFSRRSAQAMRVGKNICKLPMHKGQVIYAPEDIAYLEETFKSMMGL